MQKAGKTNIPLVLLRHNTSVHQTTEDGSLSRYPIVILMLHQGLLVKKSLLYLNASPSTNNINEVSPFLNRDISAQNVMNFKIIHIKER